MYACMHATPPFGHPRIWCCSSQVLYLGLLFCNAEAEIKPQSIAVGVLLDSPVFDPSLSQHWNRNKASEYCHRRRSRQHAPTRDHDHKFALS